MQQPFFSIIIPTFRSAATIVRALQSVLEQEFSNLEVLVLDGGSDDETASLVNSIQDKRVHFFSAPDQGPYDAMNKGIELAKGEWLYFLGSDDRLYDAGVLQQLVPVLQQSRRPAVYGDIWISGAVSWAKEEQRYGGAFTLYRLLRRNICHQAIFYRRSFVQQHQLRYNLAYPVSADWDLNLRSWLLQPFEYVPQLVAVFEAGGISSAASASDAFVAELPVRYKKYLEIPFVHPVRRFLFRCYRLFRS